MIDREALKNVLCGESHSLNAVDAIADWIDSQISAAVAAERELTDADCDAFPFESYAVTSACTIDEVRKQRNVDYAAIRKWYAALQEQSK